MNARQSVFLDALRFSAALLVVLHHFLQLGVVAGDVPPWYPDLGHEAVLAFFVLSGYVIRYVGTQRETSARSYGLARAARLYSVALPVVLLAMLLDGLGVALGETRGPAPESALRNYQYAKPWLYLPLNLGFLGQCWTLTETPFSVLPYWSLCYEAAYYLAYGVLAHTRGATRILLFALVVLVAGPKIVLLAPAWALGALTFDVGRRAGAWQRRVPARLLCPAALLGVLWLRASGLREVTASRAHAWLDGPSRFSEHLLGNSEAFLYDWVVALLVALAILMFPATGWGFGPSATRAIRWLASFTFTLYLLHVPLILVTQRHVDLDPARPVHALGLLALILGATFALGSVTEHRKRWFRAVLERVVPGGRA